jgi:mannobiose 2-epimerase
MDHHLALPAAALLALAACAPAPRTAPAATVAAHATPTAIPAAERAVLAAELHRSFREELLAPWYPRAVDTVHGGFLSQFDADWRPTGTQDRMIVAQARHV